MALPLLVLLLATSVQADVEVERQLLAMGTVLTVRVAADDRTMALAASEAAVAAVERTEARLSTRHGDSEVSVLNRAPVGRWVDISTALARDLATVSWCHRQTSGAFDPAAGKLDALERDGERARRLADIALDTGGFGKGVALDAALEAARAAGARAAMVDLGGQVAAFGQTLEVGIAHPSRRSRVVTQLHLGQGSVATSGQGEQPGHIRNPHTGSASPAFGSVTVRSESAARADCLATGLFVLGSDAALEWAASQDEVVVVVVENRTPFVQVRRSGEGTP